jgi:prevent-host-death family protein
MASVPVAEFQRNPGQYQDQALREPVFVTHDGQEDLVLLAASEYRRLKRRARQALRVEELSDAELGALAAAEPPAEAAAFNDELE